MITAAPYRRRDHRSAGSSTCVRPQPRHRDRRGQNSARPANIATTRRRAQPHRASTPPQHGPLSRPAASRASTLSAEPRTVITVVPPPAPTRRPSPESMRKDHGEGRCHHRHSHGDAVHHPPHPQPAGSHRNNTVNGACPYPHGHSQRRGTRPHHDQPARRVMCSQPAPPRAPRPARPRHGQGSRPVPCQNSLMAADQQLFTGYAALWYSLISPPTTLLRSIRAVTSTTRPGCRVGRPPCRPVVGQVLVP